LGGDPESSGARRRRVDLPDPPLRHHGTPVTRTVDADGNACGLLFLEGVLELLVGEVNDATAA
jgi:Mg2+/Co2+ transporter CorC